jgi:hypothetical protein
MELARTILKSQYLDTPDGGAGQTDGGDEGLLCAVCWTPAEDPIKTNCRHTYCSECFESQAASTENFPLICLGDSGNCKVSITMQELRRILAGGSYDTLLESALAKYIRTHAEVFRLAVLRTLLC